MKRLYMAAVHANLPAFEAVLHDAGAVDEIVFLGDIIGFGPHPAECVDLLQRLDVPAIAGNHDLEVLSLPEDAASPGKPVNWLYWTYRQLRDHHLAYIAQLPLERFIRGLGGSIHAIHHPPGAPYLHPAMPDDVLARHVASVSGEIVLCAHSHRPIDRYVDGRRLVCVPPVGQPRDGDPRAGYALETDGKLSFQRVEYDVESVVADVRAVGLEADFTQRWIEFLRTGFDEEWSRSYQPE